MNDTDIHLKHFFLIILIISSVFSSCATELKQKEISSKPTVKIEPVLTQEAIDKKISALEDLLANNKVREEDRVMAANLILDYHRIRALSQDAEIGSNLREIILILYNNLKLFDEHYFTSMKNTSDYAYTKAANDLSIKKHEILTRYINKEYSAVISECSAMEMEFGRDSINAEIGIILAMSLAAERRF
ncbi:MAG: hypothetical protein JW944_06320, partial [Deltaproteobacteria bacterium]|nr:hypothetical protein [Deltaproteobacteria bacterium]